MKDYPSLEKNHVFEEIDVFEVNNLLTNKNDFYLIMGFPTCPWCQAIMDVLDEVAKDVDENKIYYLDIKEIRDNPEAKGYTEFQNLTDNDFKGAIDTEKNRINAPTFVKVIEGKMVAYHLNTVEDHIMNENNVLPALTDAQRAELKVILKGIIEA